MKIFFLAFTLLTFLGANAQDDINDTRKKNEGFAKVSQKDLRADLATFTLSGIDESIGKSELQKIAFTSSGANFMTFEGDDIKATVAIAPFDPSKHKLDYDEKTLIKIDKKTYYGGYGAVPKTVISNVTLVIGKDSVAIPSVAYFDLYNLNFTYKDKGTQRTRNAVYKSKDGHKIYLYLLCKDKTGNYEVTWIFQDKKYLRRVLDYGFL